MGLRDIVKFKSTVEVLVDRLDAEERRVALPEVLRAERDPFASTPRSSTMGPGDGWENQAMGYGTWRDKVTHGYHNYSPRLTDWEISTLFYSDDVAAKLVTKRAEEAFRRGYKLLNGEDEKAAADVLKLGRSLNVDEKFQEAATWGSLFGGSLLIIGAEQGKLDQPLDETKVRDVKFLNVVDRRSATIFSYYLDPLAPKYGQPETYSVIGANGTTSIIHETRVIRFDGPPVDPIKRRELGGWSYSALQRPYDVMRAFATAFQAASSLTADASQAVFKMKGLFEMIASGEKERLQTRMQLVDMSRSAARAVLLDADGESFERMATQFAGLPDMLDRLMMRLASSVDMPVTILMGRSPAGQNATGDSDFQHWYDSIASQQVKEFGPKLLRLYRILSKGKLDQLQVKWCSLTEPSDKERAEVEKYEADKWGTYIDKGVLFAEEVALAKFGKSSNGEIVIDEASRKESLKLETELALNPPPPIVAPPTDPNAPKPPVAPADAPPR